MAATLMALSERLPVVALSNATLFEGSRLEALAPLGGADVAIQISLDSADPIINDAARAPDNFAKVVEAIPRLIERGIEVRIATTVDDPDADDLTRLCELHRGLGVSDDHHIVRPIVRRGRAVDHDLGVDATNADLPAELTVTADGAFWSPFGPTVHNGVVDLDLLITRTTDPLAVPAGALLALVEARPAGADQTLNIR